MATPSHDSSHYVKNECMIALILLCYVVPSKWLLTRAKRGLQGTISISATRADSVPRMHQQPASPSSMTAGLAIASLHLSRLSSLEVVNPKSVFKDGKQTFYGLKVMHYLKTPMSFHGWILSSAALWCNTYFVPVLDESRSHSQPRQNCQAGGAPPASPHN